MKKVILVGLAIGLITVMTGCGEAPKTQEPLNPNPVILTETILTETILEEKIITEKTWENNVKGWS